MSRLKFGPLPLDRVQSEACLPFGFVRSVTLVTVVGQDWTDVAIEVDQGVIRGSHPNGRRKPHALRQNNREEWQTESLHLQVSSRRVMQRVSTAILDALILTR